MDIIEKVRMTIRERGACAFFVSDPHNIAYLSGTPLDETGARSSFLILTQEKLYHIYSPSIPVPNERTSKCHGTSVRRVLARKGMFATARDILSDMRGPVLFEDDDITVKELSLIECAAGRSLPASLLIEHIRMVKDKSEQAAIKKAVRIADDVFKEVIAFLGRTRYEKLAEKDLAEKMAEVAKKKGADRPSFPTIVACGKGGAEPHHVSGNVRLRRGTLLLLDFGFPYKGYQSDISRTIALGDVPSSMRRIYDIVRENLELCTASCASGMPANELHAVAVRHFRQYGLARYFTHSLGHGIGLDVHELPNIASSREHPLTDGMVFTIEPGIYLPGKFGVRIENIVRLSDGKAITMTASPTELITIK